MRAGIFANYPAWMKLLLALGAVFIGFFLTGFLYGIIFLIMNPQAALSGNIIPDVYIMRLLQILQSFFVFIFPALLLAFLFSFNPNAYLSFGRQSKASLYALVILASIFVIPFMNWMAYWNGQIQLPEVLKPIEQWMLEAEKSAAETMEQMLQMNSFGIFLFNIFLVAVLAAVSEELFFRGLIQRLFIEFTKNAHVGIWVSALVFSAIHMQFYGFFPRMLLGAYFGYLLWWSKSIWVPILAHFVNNALAVTFSYLAQMEVVDPKWEELGSENDLVSAAISFVLFAVCMLLIYTISKKPEVSDNLDLS